jgi:pSer/pThr/pTyr-binding forkhead associated (FHA) protein
MKLSLLVTDGIHAGDVIGIEGVSLLIGRGPQCHIRPNSPAIGLRHCMLLVRGERVFLRDLGSRTGTYMNDRQLRGEIELQDGDMLQIGPLTFVVQMEAEGAPDPIDQDVVAPPGPQASQRPVEETVDLTRFDEDFPLLEEAQDVPDLEPFTEPAVNGTNGNWHAAEQARAAPENGSAPSRNGNGTKAHNGLSVPLHPVERLEPELPRLPSRARLTQRLRSRRPPS